MKKFLKFLENLMYPKNFTCDICGEEITNKNGKYSFCNECYENLPKIEGKTCICCGDKISSESDYCLTCKEYKSEFKQNFSVFCYMSPVTDIITKFKYKDKKYLGENLSLIMLDKFKSLKLDVDIIIPVPLHEIREKERGFNQAEELCKSFIDEGYNVCCDIVKRIKNTEQQTTKTRKERIENVKGVFDFIDEKKKEVKGKVVLIIDDVYTTGATLNELTRTINKGKPKAVYCLTLAHAMLEDFFKED